MAREKSNYDEELAYPPYSSWRALNIRRRQDTAKLAEEQHRRKMRIPPYMGAALEVLVSRRRPGASQPK